MIITYKSTQLTLLVTNDDGVCEYFVSLKCKVKDENWFEQKKNYWNGKTSTSTPNPYPSP